VKSRGATVDSRAIPGPAICGEATLEAIDFRAKDELRAIKDAGYRGVDLRLYRQVLRLQIKKRYQWLGPQHLINVINGIDAPPPTSEAADKVELFASKRNGSMI
jgi:hypothetical protein